MTTVKKKIEINKSRILRNLYILLSTTEISSKWSFKNQVQRFEHFDVISKVDNSKDHEKILSICILR